MGLFLYLIIIIVAYSFFSYVFYKNWELFFDTIFGTLNKYMKIASIILGILWPITLLILLIATFILVFNKVTK